MRKKLLSTMLALCIALTMLPMGVLATGEVPETSEPTTIESEPEEPQTQEDVQTDDVSTPTVEPEETAEPAPLAEDAPISGTCGDNLTWTLEKGTLIISGNGAMSDFNYLTDSQSPFFGRYNIETVIIQDGVTYIGNEAFLRCYELTSIIIPNSVTSIGNYAFSGCGGLTSIEIPNSVTSIGNYAFWYCNGLTSIEIPNSVTSIGNCAFYGCGGLTSIEIPNSVTNIGSGAFSGCSGLTSVEIPDSVTSIGNYAFSGCGGLTNIEVEEGNPNYDSRNSCNAIIRTSHNTLVSGCKNTKIPSSVTSIGNYAFSGCGGLTSIEIPNSVTSISYNAFSGCSGLTSIEIPNSVTNIGSGAFSSCSGLTSIEIPNSVTNIDIGAFSSCSGLTSIEIPNSVTNIGNGAFSSCDKLTDVHYSGSEDEWKSINIDTENECLANATIHYNSGKPDNNDKPKPPSTDDDNEPPISTDVLTFKDVHYYDTIAKTDVSVDLTWNWNDLLLRDSYVYKVNLAKMGLALSAAIEGTNFKEETNNILIGTDKENRLMLNEVTYDEDITPAMAVGIKQIKTGGETKNVIFVVLRGTTNIMDAGNDFFSSYGATQWGVNIVNYRLHSYLEGWSDKYGINKSNTKFFVTGHSLGGACANLLSAELSKECGEENVFGYTFATPSPLNKMEDISRFRGNIYNFLCLQDNVPSHFSLRDTWYGYGYPRWFNIRELSKTENTYKKLTGKYWISTYYEHSMLRLHAPSAYMAYLMADPTLNDSVVEYNYVRIKCPVDVEVYNSNNELVGRIVDDKIDYDHYAPTIKLIICDGAKYVYFLDDDTYTVKITGTGDGTMTYMAASRNINTNVDEKSKIYSNVKINPGKKFRSIVSAHDETNTDNLVEIPDVELLVTDDNGNAVAQVLPDIEASSLGKDNGTEIPIKDNNPTPDTKPGGVVPDGQPGTNTKPGENTPGTIPGNESGNNNSGVSAGFDSTNTNNISDKGNTKQNSAKSASPKTGDNTPIILYVWLIMISGLAVLFWCVISRRKNNDSIR